MQAFVEAVAESMGPRQPDAGFALRQIGRLPALPGAALALLKILFELSCLCRRGSLFRNLPVERRSAMLAAWRRSRWLPCRDFVALHEGLLWFSVYADLDGSQGSDADAAI